MISELDETIRQILIAEGGFDPSQIDVSFDIPNREWSTGISRPTINCYLFDIRENLELRQQGRQTDQTGNGVVRRQPSLRFNLTYLITAWTRAVEDEHRLLWRALQTLARHITLPREHFQGALREHELPIYTHIARPDGVLKSPGEFWTALENQIKPSLGYTVTLGLDRDALVAGPPVLTTTVRVHPPEGAIEEQLWFGGTIRDKDGAPLDGAIVEIEGRGMRARTDSEGRFRLRGAPGRYTLVARADGVIQRREIEIPLMHYDITVETHDTV